MRLVNDHDEPYVALFSVQYALLAPGDFSR